MNEIAVTLNIPTALDEAAIVMKRGLKLILGALKKIGPFEPRDTDIATIGIDTDTGKLIYNESYMQDRSKAEFRYLVTFVGLMIPFTTKRYLLNRDTERWNTAVNLFINGLMDNHGQGGDMPPGGIRDHSWDGMAVVEIYDELTFYSLKPGEGEEPGEVEEIVLTPDPT